MFWNREPVTLIVGLGNPEKEYGGTRHNVGFEVIDRLARETGISIKQKKFRGESGKGVIDGKKVVLVKPQTYMNLSGECIRPFLDFYRLDASKDLIVICDDINLETGHIRIREKGSAGGHNGLKNIIQHLNGSTEFIRVRVGVGNKPDGGDLVKHVLGKFQGKDKEVMEETEERAAKAVRELLTNPIGNVQSRYNS